MVYFLLGLVLVGLVGSSPTKSKEDVRIVGGENIDIREAPYQVSLMHRGRHSCGGAIISNDIVITAAHCVMGNRAMDFQVRAGSSSNSDGGVTVAVGDLMWHPRFTYNKMDNDVAVLWLAQPLVFSDSIAPLNLFDAGEEIEDGELTAVTGWGDTMEGGGKPDTLQRVMVHKVSEEICKEAYMPTYNISPRMLCAGEVEGGKDACQGDSGGPLVHNGKLAGIVSWGLGCAKPDYPGVYAKVSALRDWVDENIAFLRMKQLLRN